MEMWAADINNAYLEAKTLDKIYIIAGTRFGDREGHILIFSKAFYFLWYYGLWWNEKFANFLRDMGLSMWNLEPGFWTRKNRDIYEYIDLYVDDLLIVSRGTKSLMDALENKSFQD